LSDAAKGRCVVADRRDRKAGGETEAIPT